MSQKLKKDLRVFELFCIASGAMISSGLFVLPGIAFSQAGPSVILSYFIASILIIPAFLSTAELATAMPKAGGNYFFTDRSLGSWIGTLVGLSDWFSLALKSAFALIGIGTFMLLFFPGLGEMQIKIIAVAFCIISVIVNISGIKHSGRFQAGLVIILLSILGFYIIYGSFFLEGSRYTPFTPYGFNSIFATAGLVAISFGGLTKIPNIAEEVKNPGRTIPIAMFFSWLVVTILYAFVVFVTVGLVNAEQLAGSLIPISLGAKSFLGFPGSLLLGFAALLAYVTTATAGVLTASRTPFAMSRDNLMPLIFQKISSRGIPVYSILITSVFMIFIILFLSLEALIKVASTTFNSEGILERRHLQSALKRQIDVVSPNCLVISEEFAEWSGSQRRIDLLAIDKEANLVVIELKRSETGEHMELQALRYAAMVSALTFSRAVEMYQEIRSGGILVPINEAEEIYSRQGIYRHFLGEDELIEFPDATKYAVSNQWGKGTIETFINQAKKIGFEIEETS